MEVEAERNVRLVIFQIRAKAQARRTLKPKILESWHILILTENGSNENWNQHFFSDFALERSDSIFTIFTSNEIMSFQHPAWWLRLSPSHLDICLGVPKFTIAILQQTKTIVGPIRSGYSTHMAQKASFTNHGWPKKMDGPLKNRKLSRSMDLWHPVFESYPHPHHVL